MSNYIHVVFNFYTTTSQVTQLSNWSSSQQNSSKLDVHTTHNCLFQKNSLNHISTMALCRAQTRINTPVVIRINPKLWCDYYQTRTIYITREHVRKYSWKAQFCIQSCSCYFCGGKNSRIWKFAIHKVLILRITQPICTGKLFNTC